MDNKNKEDFKEGGLAEGDVSVYLGHLIDLDNENSNSGLDALLGKWQPFKRVIVGCAVSIILGGFIIYPVCSR